LLSGGLLRSQFCMGSVKYSRRSSSSQCQS
jgi:hypothetical protein